MQTYYTSKPLDAHLTAITSLSGVRCFLVQGSERALLLDTCGGAGDLAAFVAGLTDKPLTVWVTHGHVDHVGGAAWFGEVHINEADAALARKSMTLAARQAYARETLPDLALPADAFCPAEGCTLAGLDDGDTIDLGGLHAQAVAFPGHTRGSMTVLLPELGTVLFGDACNQHLYLFGPCATTVEEYRAQANFYRKNYSNLYSRALVSHGPHETVDPVILNNCITLCEQILAGLDDRLPMQELGQPVLYAKRETHTGVRADGGFGNIVYGADKLPAGE